MVQEKELGFNLSDLAYLRMHFSLVIIIKKKHKVTAKTWLWTLIRVMDEHVINKGP